MCWKSVAIWLVVSGLVGQINAHIKNQIHEDKYEYYNEERHLSRNLELEYDSYQKACNDKFAYRLFGSISGCEYICPGPLFLRKRISIREGKSCGLLGIRVCHYGRCIFSSRYPHPRYTTIQTTLPPKTTRKLDHPTRGTSPMPRRTTLTRITTKKITKKPAVTTTKSTKTTSKKPTTTTKSLSTYPTTLATTKPPKTTTKLLPKTTTSNPSTPAPATKSTITNSPRETTKFTQKNTPNYNDVTQKTSISKDYPDFTFGSEIALSGLKSLTTKSYIKPSLYSEDEYYDYSDDDFDDYFDDLLDD